MLILVSVILAVNAVWHGLAGYLFTFRPRWTIEQYSAERPVNTIAVEVMRFLGALNLAVVVLALLAIVRPAGARILVMLFLFLANFSQFAVDLRVRKLGLTNRHFDLTILAGDGIMSIINLGTVLALIFLR